jgi:D-alanyl-D-alanine carboxypeptidase
MPRPDPAPMSPDVDDAVGPRSQLTRLSRLVLAISRATRNPLANQTPRRSSMAILALSTSIVAACADGDETKRTATTTAHSATTPAVSDTTVAVSDTRVAVPNSTAAVPDTTMAVPDATAQLQTVVEEAVRASPSIPGLALHVEAPGQHLDLSVAAGVADRTNATPLTPDAGFRVASNTKTFTAATILRLVEQSQLVLDDSIADLLAPETVDALRAGGYRPDTMTVRQVLLHTGGIYNHGQDPAFQAAVEAEPAKRWTRLELVRFAMDHGNPVGEPGTVHSYSDTGYLLLGEIIERAADAPLAEAYRTLLDFEGLHLDATYLESLEPAPPDIAARAHQYIGDFDGFEMDPSFDGYGPAGLVSTVDDLSTFYRALLIGDVFTEPETLDTMLEIPVTNTESGAGMGIFRIDVGGNTCWQHSGFWGTFVLTCPQIDVTIAASWAQATYPDFDSEIVFRRVLEVAMAP